MDVDRVRRSGSLRGRKKEEAGERVEQRDFRFHEYETYCDILLCYLGVTEAVEGSL